MSDQYDDPFAIRERHPSISWKGAPVGATIVCKVLERPAVVAARDFETGKPDTWDNGDPKHNVVIPVEVNGEKRSLFALQWAKAPLFEAIAKAQQEAGAQIAPGGTLTITYTGDKPNDNPRLNAQRLFSARYEPPAAFGDWQQSDASSASSQSSQSSGDAWSPSASSEPPF